jgi:hypothetical protein
MGSRAWDIVQTDITYLIGRGRNGEKRRIPPPPPPFGGARDPRADTLAG